MSERVSPIQAAKCYRLLMAFLNTAAEDDLIAKNRCRLRCAAAENSDERPLIPVSQALALVEAIEPPYGALLLLAATCGLRLGELLGLTRGDLDFLHRRVLVTKQRQELSSGIEVRRPKTAAGVRDVTMPEAIVSILETHLAIHVEPGPEAPLFAGPKGGIRRASFYKAWQRALAKTGIRADLKPHDLRHPGQHDGGAGARDDHQGPHGADGPGLEPGRAALSAHDGGRRQGDVAGHRPGAAAGDGIRQRDG